MTKRTMKYNPSFLSEAELIEGFVVRHADLEIIIRIIEENITDSNQHVLVIGPRGSGKTTLVHRVAAEVGRNKELSDRWYPLIFSEESYEVVTAGEFWLEALFHLSEQVDVEKWKRSFIELKKESDEQRLANRALAQLLDFADSQGKRVLMIVENLNMLFGDLTSEEEAWKIRHTLVNEPRLMLLATATNRFEHMENSSKAMFEMFKMQELKPLDDDECNSIWEHITGQRLLGERIKPVRILTGGNPRLLTIIAKFSAHSSFRKLLDDLVDLIDDHTEYFKSHLDNLPAIERKVYLALAGLWDASTAREIAEAARLDVSKTSSLLGRLVNRGAVVVEEHGKKTKWYVVAERMYNIYYLMRRRGKLADRVKATVRFLVSMYDPESAARLITEEACRLPTELRRDHCLAYEMAVKEVPDRHLFNRIIASTPKSFLESPYLSEAFRTYIAEGKEIDSKGEVCGVLDDDLKKAREIYEQGAKQFAAGDYDLALTLLDRVIGEFGNTDNATLLMEVAQAMVNKGVTLVRLNRNKETIDVCDEMSARFADADEKVLREAVAQAMINKGIALGRLNRSEEAIAVFDDVVARLAHADEAALHEPFVRAMINKGYGLGKLNRDEEAIAVYDEIVARFADTDETALREQVARAMVNKGYKLGQLNRNEEAIAVFDDVVARFADTDEVALREPVARAMVNKGYNLGLLNSNEAAIAVYDEVVARFVEAEEVEIREQVARAMVNKGYRLGQLNRYEEEIAIYDEVVARFADADEAALREPVARALVNKGNRLGRLNRSEEAIATYDEVVARFAETNEEAFRKHVASALSNKGDMLDMLNKYEEAEKVFRKAIAFSPDATWNIIRRIELLLKMPGRFDDALQIAEEIISKKPEDAELLNWVAWILYKHNDLGILPKAESWAIKAVSLLPDNACIHHTLACILSALGKGREALDSARLYYQDASLVEKNIEDAIELIVALAASGQAKEALEILIHSQAVKHLEPLVVGLKLYIGEDVKTAPEIREVAKDVVKRIENRLESWQ